MDPTATLAEFRKLYREALKAADVLDFDDPAHEVLRDLAERCEALDDWMTIGGFNPWRPRPAAIAPTYAYPVACQATYQDQIHCEVGYAGNPGQHETDDEGRDVHVHANFTWIAPTETGYHPC